MVVLIRSEGYRVIDYDSDCWADHDERCHGRLETLVNDPTYVDGCMWDCCKEPIDEPGCTLSMHAE